MIDVLNLCFSYNDKPLIDNFSMKINDGEAVCLKGESGCGKTTLLRIILGLETAQSGTVLSPNKLSVVFQEDRLIEHLSIKKNLLMIDGATPKLVDNLLLSADLYQSRNKKVSLLSGGMKRRVAILRAIIFNGDALLLDEPFNGLDLENKQRMVKIIKEFYQDKNKPVLIISHIKEDTDLLNAKVIEM